MSLTTAAGINGVQDLRELQAKNDPESLRKVAKEVEALFAHEMIKAMRQASQVAKKGGLGGDIYSSLFDLQLARLFAERGLGLQDMVIKELQRGVAKAGTKALPSTPPTQGDEASSDERAAPGKQVLGAPLATAVASKDKVEAKGKIEEFAMPVRGVLTSHFGRRKDPFTGDKRFHHGIDIAAPQGSTVYPAKAGTVVFSGESGEYGKMVVVDHDKGTLTRYAHNSENLVKVGDRVDQQTPIARVGSTGRSTGPHLHFEVRHNGKSVNPSMLLAGNMPKEIPGMHDKRENVS